MRPVNDTDLLKKRDSERLAGTRPLTYSPLAVASGDAMFGAVIAGQKTVFPWS